MHSFGYRVNALLTLGVTTLALMCAMASFSDNFNYPSPSADVQVMNVNWFQRQSTGNDEVSLTLKISADLQSTFTWNTKQSNAHGDFCSFVKCFSFLAAEYETPDNDLNQISLWDSIIPSKERAKFTIHTKSKYRLIDQGSNLCGKDFDLTLYWHAMPKTRKMFADRIPSARGLQMISLNYHDNGTCIRGILHDLTMRYYG